MARRLNTASKPYRVVSVRKGRAGRTADFSEGFSDSAAAQKRADKLAKEKDIISIYIQELDANGYPINMIAVKRPEKAQELTVTGDSDDTDHEFR